MLFVAAYMILLKPQINSKRHLGKTLTEKKQEYEAAEKAAEEQTRIELNEQIARLRECGGTEVRHNSNRQGKGSNFVKRWQWEKKAGDARKYRVRQQLHRRELHRRQFCLRVQSVRHFCEQSGETSAGLLCACIQNGFGKTR